MLAFYWTSLLLLPLPVFSQSQPGKPEKTVYVGLEAGYHAYRSGFNWMGQGVAPTVTVGTTLQPGLSLQLGLSTSQRRSEHREQWVDRASYPQPFPIYAHYQTRLRTVQLPILLRADVGRPALGRLQAQGGVGITLMVDMQTNKSTLADSTCTIYFSDTDQYRSFGLGLTGGAGLCYAVGAHIDLTAQTLVTLPLRSLGYGLSSVGMTSMVSIGTRYYFKARLQSETIGSVKPSR
ncbi:outer membrane beta-barrel protein [Hymenobacter glacieicola]|uniref:Outer membrane protein beta-barrel domain-containing protein n=1 Tax=Hymenobacter glacieicola TaxID=1562124 RepID=A0ABQ1X4U7_9BACT|nr:hypothetical protein GCM10011378_40040 [Hymenobacter glacieicola]